MATFDVKKTPASKATVCGGLYAFTSNACLKSGELSENASPLDAH